MKKLLFISVFLVAFACSKEDDQKDVDPIIGNWRYVSVNYNGSFVEKGAGFVEVKFFEDGTGIRINLGCSDYVQIQGCIDFNIPIVGKTLQEANNIIATNAVSALGSPAENCIDCESQAFLWTRVEETKTQKMTYELRGVGSSYHPRSQIMSSLPEFKQNYLSEFQANLDNMVERPGGMTRAELLDGDSYSLEMTFSEDYSSGSGIFQYSGYGHVPNILYKVN